MADYFELLAAPKPINGNFSHTVEKTTARQRLKTNTNDRLRVDLKHANELAEKRLQRIEQLESQLGRKISRANELSKINDAINKLSAIVKSLILDDVKKEQSERLKQESFSSIAESVAEYCDVTLEDMKGRCRDRKYVRARAIFYAITNKVYSSIEVGKFLNRDHSTVLHALNNLDKSINKVDYEFINYYDGKHL